MNNDYDFDVIQIIPIQSEKKIISNEMNLKNVDNMDIPNFQPDGTYTFTSSSWSSDTTEAHNAFDNNSSTFWECDYKNNKNYDELTRNYPPYLQDPYNNVSTYQSGGNVENIATTQVGSDKLVDVLGEWIQIKLPYKCYLFDYSIRTPPFGRNNTFPTKFTLIGSIDGEQWDKIKEHNDFKDGLPRMPIVEKKYNINSKKQYSHFRFIFNRSGKNMNVIRINKISLSGTRELVKNPNIINESFSLIGGGNNSIKNTLENFVNTDNTSLENSSSCKKCNDFSNKKKIISFCNLTGVIALSILLYFSLRTKR